MNQYQSHKAADAEFLRSHLGDKTSTWSTLYGRRGAMRPVRVVENNEIEVLVGAHWRSTFVSPTGLRELVVRA